MKMILKFLRDEEGLTTVEYAIAGSILAVAIVTAFGLLGTGIENTIDDLITAMTPATV